MSAFILKLIAALTMLIDHTGLFLFPGLTWMRIVGRFAFPLYAFLVAEGVAHTRSIPKYLIRMGICAAAAEVAYDLCLSGNVICLKDQCTVWTLSLGIISCVIWDLCKKKQRSPALSILATALLCLSAEYLHLDYGFFGVLLVFLFYLCREESSPALRMLLRTASLALCLVGLFYVYNWSVLLFAILAAPLICLYNGKRGPKLAYLFYIYYPLHLFVLYILRLLLH